MGDVTYHAKDMEDFIEALDRIKTIAYTIYDANFVDLTIHYNV